MRLHLLGIGGTFMAGLARIAKQAGHHVVGSDLNLYPPMSLQLAADDIPLFQGYDPAHIDPEVDCVIIGNIMRRGNPVIEYVLNKGIPYTSGPAWLAEHILQNRWVCAVSGTHGKTTTASLLARILDYAGLRPGFLIGGVPENFGVSASLGDAASCFVIEADEYDSAFFDKRSKFIHYRPKTLIINNLEFDHADIFPDLESIKQQFHYLVRTVPGNGLLVYPSDDEHVQHVLDKGCWTPTVSFGSEGFFEATCLKADGSHFIVNRNGSPVGEVKWNLLGQHNVNNALAALAASSALEVPIEKALAALPLFKSVKRRLEVKGEAGGVIVYDDFAHHPTAIATTLSGLRAKIGIARMMVVLEFGSYTMRSGKHKETIKEALTLADMVFCKRPESDTWDVQKTLNDFTQPTVLCDTIDDLVAQLIKQLKSGDHVVVMSNSGFGGIHQKILYAMGGE